MINVPFNGLPRAVRERLVKLTTETTDNPQRLLSSPSMRAGWVPWFFGLVALVPFGLCVDFILRRHSHGIRPHSDIEVYAGAAAALFVFFLCATRIVMRLRWPKPPYRTGQWVLSSGLMELSDGTLKLLPLDKLGKPTLVTVRRNGSYQHTRLDLTHNFSFTYGRPKDADEAVMKVLVARELYAKALGARDEATLRVLDPLVECTLSGVWATTENSVFGVEGPLATPIPWSAIGLQWLVCALLAFIVPGAAYEYLGTHFT